MCASRSVSVLHACMCLWDPAGPAMTMRPPPPHSPADSRRSVCVGVNALLHIHSPHSPLNGLWPSTITLWNNRAV